MSRLGQIDVYGLFTKIDREINKYRQVVIDRLMVARKKIILKKKRNFVEFSHIKFYSLTETWVSATLH